MPQHSAPAGPLADAPPAGPDHRLPRLTLKRGEAGRLAAGHRWVFSNEVWRLTLPDGAPATKGSIPAGALVAVHAENGRFLGTAHYNPATLIAARLLGGSEPPLDADAERAWLAERLRVAAAKRAPLLTAGRDACRVVHADADGLPGLIVDRYGPVAVAQILSAGMERLRDDIVAALRSIDGLRYVREASSGGFREMEGLEERVGWVGDEPSEPVTCATRLGAGVDLRFRVDFERGQKTAEFLDQVENRAWLVERLARDGGDLSKARALDLFCHTGHWGVALAMLGVGEVRFVDASAAALESAGGNAILNGVAAKCRAEKGDAFEALERFRAKGETFDVVVVDPPAFAKTRKTAAQALGGYERLNALAMRVAAPGALVVSCSCSQHIEQGAFMSMLTRAARKAGRTAWVVEERSQSSDHPALLGMDETRYLKLVALRMLE